MKYFILKRKEDFFEDQATIIEVIDAGNFGDMYADGTKANSSEKPTKLFYTPYKGKIPDYVSGTNSFPIISERFKKIVEQSDSNLEFVNVQLLSMGKDEIDLDKNFFFFNILDNVSCFDFEKSVYITLPSAPKVPLKIKKFVLLEDQISDRSIFRIKESRSNIIIREDVKIEMEKESISGLEFEEI
jgi:hypothetical protein